MYEALSIVTIAKKLHKAYKFTEDTQEKTSYYALPSDADDWMKDFDKEFEPDSYISNKVNDILEAISELDDSLNNHHNQFEAKRREINADITTPEQKQWVFRGYNAAKYMSKAMSIRHIKYYWDAVEAGQNILIDELFENTLSKLREIAESWEEES